MIKLKEVVIVEGKYDKIKLSSILDANIITTDGFGIFKDKDKQRYLKKLAEKNGAVIITDSDSGGLVIRNFLKNIIPSDKIKNVYVPEISGKERRKNKASKEGLLGVEGLSNKVLSEALNRFGVVEIRNENSIVKITQENLFDDGLIGKENSSEKRKSLCRLLRIPQNLSKNALLKTLNDLMDYEEYKLKIEELDR
ncbi:MAG: toprim domain-containing protein [Candidatus Fimenecus sp.]